MGCYWASPHQTPKNGLPRLEASERCLTGSISRRPRRFSRLFSTQARPLSIYGALTVKRSKQEARTTHSRALDRRATIRTLMLLTLRRTRIAGVEGWTFPEPPGTSHPQQSIGACLPPLARMGLRAPVVWREVRHRGFRWSAPVSGSAPGANRAEGSPRGQRLRRGQGQVLSWWPKGDPLLTDLPSRPLPCVPQRRLSGAPTAVARVGCEGARRRRLHRRAAPHLRRGELRPGDRYHEVRA